MKLIFLGTSAAQPTPDRGLSCTCLILDREILMFDAGEGTQTSFQKANLGWNKKMKLFITHLHGDHCIGLLGLLQTMQLQNRTETIDIFGPSGIEDFLSHNLRILNFKLTFPFRIRQIAEGLIFEDSRYTVHACEAEHSIPAYSFLFSEKDNLGKFNPEKAKNLGIPEGKLWKELQDGNEIKIENKIIKPSDVLEHPKKGKKIGISGDTRPTKKLEDFFIECDYLAFDSTYGDESHDKALKYYHATAKEAAILAKQAGVSNLILTHFSARYKNVDNLVTEALTVHNSVIAAKDFLEIHIK